MITSKPALSHPHATRNPSQLEPIRKSFYPLASPRTSLAAMKCHFSCWEKNPKTKQYTKHLSFIFFVAAANALSLPPEVTEKFSKNRP